MLYKQKYFMSEKDLQKKKINFFTIIFRITRNNTFAYILKNNSLIFSISTGILGFENFRKKESASSYDVGLEVQKYLRLKLLKQVPKLKKRWIFFSKCTKMNAFLKNKKSIKRFNRLFLKLTKRKRLKKILYYLRSRYKWRRRLRGSRKRRRIIRNLLYLRRRLKKRIKSFLLSKRKKRRKYLEIMKRKRRKYLKRIKQKRSKSFYIRKQQQKRLLKRQKRTKYFYIRKQKKRMLKQQKRNLKQQLRSEIDYLKKKSSIKRKFIIRNLRIIWLGKKRFRWEMYNGFSFNFKNKIKPYTMLDLTPIPFNGCQNKKQRRK